MLRLVVVDGRQASGRDAVSTAHLPVLVELQAVSDTRVMCPCACRCPPNTYSEGLYAAAAPWQAQLVFQLSQQQ